MRARAATNFRDLRRRGRIGRGERASRDRAASAPRARAPGRFATTVGGRVATTGGMPPAGGHSRRPCRRRRSRAGVAEPSRRRRNRPPIGHYSTLAETRLRERVPYSRSQETRVLQRNARAASSADVGLSAAALSASPPSISLARDRTPPSAKSPAWAPWPGPQTPRGPAASHIFSRGPPCAHAAPTTRGLAPTRTTRNARARSRSPGR